MAATTNAFTTTPLAPPLLPPPVSWCLMSSLTMFRIISTFTIRKRFLLASPQGTTRTRTMVSLHGEMPVRLSVGGESKRSDQRRVDSASSRKERNKRSTVDTQPPPADPSSLSSPEHLEESAGKLHQWFHDKQSVLCITGAGLSTESGIPDYRGHDGSYQRGHKPMVHDQFIKSSYQRKRYWGRSMVGWKDFDMAKPNLGHYALAKLEQMKKIGVTFDHQQRSPTSNNEEEEYHTSSSKTLSIITQNVDTLHTKAHTEHVCELHGRGDRLQCMNCGRYHSRRLYHQNLEHLNRSWLDEALSAREEDSMRPDGDANLRVDSYDDVIVPPCPSCSTTSTISTDPENDNKFLKPDVVFFGDNVPRSRVDLCYDAVRNSDGLLCVGTSLAVHSAFRFVQEAVLRDVDIAILNVGVTRAERQGLDVLKVESAIGPTLSRLVDKFLEDEEIA